MTTFNVFELSGLLTLVSSGLMAVLMLLLGRSRLHYIWGTYCLSVLFWGVGAYFIATTLDKGLSLFIWKATHVGVIFIPVIFTHFVFEFLGIKKRLLLFILYAAGLLLLAANLFTDFFIADVRFAFGQFYYITPTPLYTFYTALFFILVFYTHILLYRGFKGTKNELQKSRIKYFFLGVLISFAGGSISFLPVFYVDLYPFMNLTVFVYPIIVAYAILKHRLFDIKVVATQLLIYLFWMFILIRFFLSDGLEDKLLNAGFLAASVVLGIFLIRSVLREVRVREELAVANERLKELDLRKSEFVSLASHQLRSPLTAIKGYASMMLEGSFGELSLGTREAIGKMYRASERLLSVVEDFLTISRIELDQMKYDFRPVDLCALVRTIAGDLRSVVEHKDLALNLNTEKHCMVSADTGKLAQVIGNLIDNAIKYTPRGTIIVTVRKDAKNGMALLSVADTGVGMSAEALGRIFQKFSRAKDAAKVNTHGTGLGLYVVSEIVKAHGGRAWAESDGKDRGSTFFVELPLAGERT